MSSPPMDSPPSPPNRPGVPVAPPRIPQGERDAKVEATFNSAMALPPEERSRFLDHSCQEDDALHAEVRALLLAHEAAEGFMGDDPSLSSQVERELTRVKPEEAGEEM